MSKKGVRLSNPFEVLGVEEETSEGKQEELSVPIPDVLLETASTNINNVPKEERERRIKAHQSNYAERKTTITSQDVRNTFLKQLSVVTEPHYLDFKSNVYDLKRDSEILELVVDAISLYNSEFATSGEGSDQGPSAFLIFGVDNKSVKGYNRICGIRRNFDNQKFQVILSRNVNLWAGIFSYHLINDVPDEHGSLHQCSMLEIHKRNVGPMRRKLYVDGKWKLLDEIYSRGDGSNTPSHLVEGDVRAMVVARFKKNFDDSACEEMSQIIKTLPEVIYRILIITRPSHDAAEYYHLDSPSIGTVKWDLILDLDYYSSSTGAYKYASSILEKSRPCVPIFDLFRVRTLSFQKGCPCYWVFLNGSSAPNHQPQDVSVIKNALRSIFISFFMDKTPKKVLCFTLLCSDFNVDVQLAKTVQNQIKKVHKGYISRWGSDSIDYITALTEPSLDATDFGEYWTIPFSQIMEMFKSLSGATFTGEIKIPATSKGKGSIAPDYFAEMKSSIQLYHLNCDSEVIAKEQEASKQGKYEDYQTSVQREYFRGTELSIEALHLKAPLWRTEYDEILEDITERLNRNLSDWFGVKLRRPNPGSYDNLFGIEHEPSAGGTTLGRLLLWHFRKKYPCLEITDESEQNFSRLQHIYERAGSHPLVIFLDRFSSNFTRNLADFLRGNVEKVIKAVVIFTTHQHDSYLDCKYHLSMKLSKDLDILNFKNAYQKSGGDVVGIDQVPLFGLATFVDWSKTESFVNTCFEMTSPAEKRILLLSTFLYFYAGVPLPYHYMCILLRKSPFLGEKVLSHITIGCKALLITYFPREHFDVGVWPPTRQVADRLGQKWSLLSDGFEEFFGIFDSSITSMHLIARELFITYKSVPSLKNSTFVCEYAEKNGADSTCELLHRFLAKYDDAEIRGHFARFIQWKCDFLSKSEKAEKATSQIEHAIKSTGDVVSRRYVSLHTIFGDILRNQINDIPREDSEEYKNKVSKLARDGLYHYSLGRKIEGNYYGYTGAAMLVRDSFRWYKKACCSNSDPIIYKLISDQSAKGYFSQKTIHGVFWVLDKLEDVANQQAESHLVFDNEVRRAWKVRLEILREFGDVPYEYSGISIRIKENPNLYGPAVGYLVRRDENDSRRQKKWYECSKAALELVTSTLLDRVKNKLLPKLRSDFHDYLCAMIYSYHVRNPETATQRFQFAGQIAFDWTENFADDPYAFLFFATIRFIEGFHEQQPLEQKKVIEEAMKLSAISLKKTSERKFLKTTKDVFYFGNGPQFAAIVPGDLRYCRTSQYYSSNPQDIYYKLREFSGRLHRQEGALYVVEDTTSCILKVSNKKFYPGSEQYDRHRDGLSVKFIIKFNLRGIEARVFET
eukprot:TRINITY_DN22208_c0_g1_i1.p1 TRINITY_DN22208_c0_g1~~TRINITY_DN22208_c0_g1_i1.p1  ORF type:complete len:1357 (-),score=179.60 TRINITY_DN22208_c0_g1_i1:242-4312(-)